MNATAHHDDHGIDAAAVRAHTSSVMKRHLGVVNFRYE